MPLLNIVHIFKPTGRELLINMTSGKRVSLITRYRHLKMNAYIGKQKAMDELVKRLTWGSEQNQEGHNNRPRTQILDRWKRAPNVDPGPDEYVNGMYNKQIVLAFGDASLGPAMRGTRPAPNKAVIKAINLKSKELGRFPVDYPVEWLRGKKRLVLVFIDEYLTSQIGSNAYLAVDEPGERVEHKDGIYAVVSFRGCPSLWNRDINAARNMNIT